jgi:hypothetical protein
MVRVFVFLAAVQLVLVVLALISSLSVDRVRIMPRAVWVLVILLVPLIGPLIYFVTGRPVSDPGRIRPPAPARPAAPDDDPEFLRTLNPDRSRRDREFLEQWERDLKRRSDEADAARGDAARTEEGDADAARKDETPPSDG